MVDEKKIVLLTDFIEQKVRKEKELEYDEIKKETMDLLFIKEA